MNNEIVSPKNPCRLTGIFVVFGVKHQLHDKKRALRDIFSFWFFICSIITVWKYHSLEGNVMSKNDSQIVISKKTLIISLIVLLLLIVWVLHMFWISTLNLIYILCKYFSIPVSGRSPTGGNSNLLQYSCLGNPMDRGAWQAMAHSVARSHTRLSDWARKHVWHAGS